MKAEISLTFHRSRNGRYIFVLYSNSLDPQINFSINYFIIVVLRWEKMKLFESTRSSLAMLGIRPKRSNHRYVLDSQMVMVCFFYCYALVSTGVLFYGPHSFEEYLDIFFLASINIVGAVCYTIVLLRMEKLFLPLDMFEQIINGRKSS